MEFYWVAIGIENVPHGERNTFVWIKFRHEFTRTQTTTALVLPVVCTEIVVTFRIPNNKLHKKIQNNCFAFDAGLEPPPSSTHLPFL